MSKIIAKVVIVSNKIDAKKDSSAFGIELTIENNYTNTFEGEIKDLSFLEFTSSRVKVPVQKDDGTIVYPYQEQIESTYVLQTDDTDTPLTPSDIGAATAEQGMLAENAVPKSMLDTSFSDDSVPKRKPGGAIEVGTAVEGADAINKTYLDQELESKVDKVEGMGLSENSFTTIEKNKLQNLENFNNGSLLTSIDGKVDKINGLGLSETSFTTDEKEKLAIIQNRWGGRHNSLTSLQQVTGDSGWQAFLSIDGGPIEVYVWDTVLGEWESSLLAAGEETPESIKSKYESNPDTNSFTNSYKNKVDGIAVQATKNDTDVNLKNRANHFGSQPATTITQTSTYRFTTDAEKGIWNGKQNSLVSGTNIKTINGISILGGGNIDTNRPSVITDVDYFKVNEYPNRFEYTTKQNFNINVPANSTTAVATPAFLPAGTTISGFDEHYISIRNNQRSVFVSVYDGSDRRIVVGFGNNGAAVTAIGSVFIKLVKYK